MRKYIPATLLLAFFAAAVIYFGFPRKTGDRGREEQASGILNIYTWGDYLDPSVIDAFSARYHCRVIVKTYDDEEEIVPSLNSDPAAYDVVFPSDSLAEEMCELKLLEKLDPSRIPNRENIYPELLELPYKHVNTHSVPWDWGTTGIIYNKKFLPDPEKSWKVLWNGNYRGRVAVINNPYTVIGMVSLLLGQEISPVDPKALKKVELWMQSLKENKAAIVTFSDLQKKMKAEEIWLAQAYNGDAAVILKENPDYGYFLPSEGSDLYFDTIAVPRNAAHKESAYLFINFLLEAENHARCNIFSGYATTSRRAVEKGLIPERILKDPITYPERKKLFLYKVFLGPANKTYNRLWADFGKERG